MQTAYDRILAPKDDQHIPRIVPESDAQISDLHPFKFVDAFQMPRLIWSDETKLFEILSSGSSKPPILGPISRSLYLRHRYHLLRQVILRNKRFSSPEVTGVAAGENGGEGFTKVQTAGSYKNTQLHVDALPHHRQLTSIKDMSGRVGWRFLLFGILGKMQDDSYCLEDLDGRVKLDLSNAVSS